MKFQPQVLFRLPEMELKVTIEHLIARQLIEAGKDFFFVEIGAFDGVTNNVLRQWVENNYMISPEGKADGKTTPTDTLAISRCT